MANDDGVDWDLVDIRLAVAEGPEGKKRRDQLFRQLDPNGNRSLALIEVVAGLGGLLENHDSWRKKDTTAEGLIPGVSDFRPAIIAAFNNARHLGNSQSKSDEDVVDRTEFHALLVYFRHYLELLVLFKRIDDDDDKKLSAMEIMPAIAQLRKWDITAAMVMSKLKMEGGQMSFDHFAEFCLHNKLKSLTFDELEGAEMMRSAQKSPDAFQAGKGAVNWALVDERIPTGQGEEARAARDALFKKIDVTHNGHLNLVEVQAAIGALLECDHAQRKKDEAAETIIPGIRDTRPAAKSAFRASMMLGAPVSKKGKAKKKGKRQGDDTVDRREFHALLVYLRHYLELQVLFQDVDTDEDCRVSKDECNLALDFLARWGIDRAGVQKKFSESKGDLKFTNFADWCLQIKLDGHKFDVLEDDHDDPGERTCPNGHQLENLGTSEHGGWQCEGRDDPDGCMSGITGINQTAGISRYRCEECNYDLCERCALNLPFEAVVFYGEQAAQMMQETVKVAVDQEMEQQEAYSVLERSAPASPQDMRTTDFGTLGRLPRLARSCGSLPFESQGVLKRPPHLKTLSTVKSLPKWKFGEKRPLSFIMTNDNPAPGSYVVPAPQRTGKYRENAGYSFGGGASRFDHDPHPGKLQPAPGEYGIPRNPTQDALSRASGFSKYPRGNRSTTVVRGSGPGPGAYEIKTTVGGISCTAKGKLTRVYKPTAALPGPGAYHPKPPGILTTEKGFPQIGFGTGPAREEFAALHQARTPGPGAYEHDNWEPMGKVARKFSFRSRVRCASNFNTFICPGPGSYDGDGTCFGY